RVAQLIGRWPLPAWLEYGFPASMAYAAVVITVGLADRTLQVRHERDQAHRMAEFDALTGVLNRGAILRRLRDAWDTARAQGQPLAVLFLDIDHFKRINDTRGHAAGDACLRAVVGAIQEQLGASGRRVPVGDQPVELTVSLGVAAMQGDTPSVETMVECADTAQYRAKALGRNRAVMYRHEDVAQALAAPSA